MTESGNYSRGRSGIGAPNYSSPAWRAGDLEKQRAQEKRVTQQIDNSSNPDYYPSNRDESDTPGLWYTVFCVIVFIVASLYGLYVLEGSLPPETSKMIRDAIDSNGYIPNDGTLFLVMVAVLAVVGFLIRKLLEFVVALGIFLAIAWGLVSVIWSFLAE